MKLLGCMVILFFGFWLPAQNPDSGLFRFARPALVGQKHHFSIRADEETRAELSLPNQLPGSARGVSETLSVRMDGVTETLAVNASGNSTRLRITIDHAEALKDETRNIPLSLNGKGFLADLSRKTPVFVREDRVKLSHDESLILGLVFRPALNSTLNDLYGTDTVLGKGLFWRPPLDAMLKVFKENRLDILPDEITAAASSSPCTVENENCQRLNLRLRTLPTREDVEVLFEMSAIMPVDASKPALRMRRTNVFTTRQPFTGVSSEGQPLPQGARLIQQSKETIMIDVKPLTLKGRS